MGIGNWMPPDQSPPVTITPYPDGPYLVRGEFVVRDRPAADVAAELGISVNSVYLAKSRVLRRLREELAGLLD